jgi:hypothetical protein
MKFLVECGFKGMVMLGHAKQLCDSADFTVEARTARAAEFKVLTCYPDLLRCEAKALGLQGRNLREMARELRGLVLWFFGLGGVMLYECYSNDAVFPPATRFTWSNGIIGAAVASVVILFVAGAFSYFETGKVTRELEQVAVEERDHCRRLGYVAGWLDHERGRPAEFRKWVEEASADIQAYPGPAVAAMPH